jgi:uncharacterized protein (TIGR02466 family)
MRIRRWFPTGIYEAVLRRRNSDDFVRALRVACEEVRDDDHAGQALCLERYPSVYTSYGTLRNLNRTLPPFRELEAKLWPHVQRFADLLDMDLSEANLAMTECWLNFMGRGGAHRWHDHPGAVISGTFYVETPHGSSPLHFEDPRIGRFVSEPPKRGECRPANRARVAYEAHAGKVILFQSWLRHEVPSQLPEGERISVSFNYSWV